MHQMKNEDKCYYCIACNKSKITYGLPADPFSMFFLNKRAANHYHVLFNIMEHIDAPGVAFEFSKGFLTSGLPLNSQVLY